MKSKSAVVCLSVPTKWSLLATIVAALYMATPAVSINIVPIYNAGASVEPGQDPTGALLMSLFDYAELYYQDIFEDSFTLTINFWWEDLDPIGTGVLGVHNRLVESGGYNIESNIRLDNDRSWFIDSTPEDDSEFDMNQILWRDLTPTEQSNYFNDFGASIPETFEVGYRGSATPGGAADGVYDLLSTVLHETGHALGLTGATNTVTETNDGDYDFTSAFVFGQTLAAEHETGDRYHLDDPFSMMCGGCGGLSLRRRPSHTDLFSMASADDFLNLDVPRREFYGGSNWNTAGNWSGNQVPGSADDVFVRDPGAVVTANLSAAGVAANLNVSEGGNVDTEGFKLDVGGTVTISDLNSDIFVRTAGELEATTINVENDAELNVEGGLVDANTIIVTQGTTATFLQGTGGTIDVLTTLRNNATIRALSGGTLTFTSTGGNVWDLDGTGAADGVVQAVAGNLNFASGSVADAFDGDIDVGDGTNARTLTIAQPWSLGAGGIVDLSGGASTADRAAIAGGTWTATTGDINANAGINQIQSPVVLGSSLDVVVADGATLEFTGSISNGGGDYSAIATGQLEFVGATTYTGGTLNVTGIVQQNGDATVNGNTTINGERFDLDGDVGAGVDWIISAGSSLILNVDSVESAGTAGFFDGTMTINGGAIALPTSLTVNLTSGNEWTMAGTLNTNGTADPFIVTTIAAGTDFNLSGTANVSGNNSWGARVDVSGTINVNANSAVRLTGGTLADPNRLEGGTITGAGSLSATTNDALHGSGTINTSVSFLNNAELRADNGTLTVNGTINDVGIIGTADTDGILEVTNAWNTSIANALQLNGGQVIGANITNDGTTSGFGTIASNGFNNNGTFSANGGTLILNTTNFPDVDGSAETGVINALNGNVEIVNATGVVFAFDGQINVGAGRQFRWSGHGLGNGGTVNLTRGTVDVLNFQQSAQLNVNAGGTSLIQAPTIDFTASGSNVLNDNLRLQGTARIFNGANFAGPGKLIVNPGSTLKIENGTSTGANVVNLGLTAVGFSTGVARIAAFEQSGAATYEVEIDGTTPGAQYDQLYVVGNAALAGELSVLLNQNGGVYADPAVPGTVDEFVLILAGSITGSFDTVVYDGTTLVPDFGVGVDGDFEDHVGAGLFRIVDYSPSDMRLLNYKALAGDANGDGNVDGTDFGIWNANKFMGGTDWTTGDFNGDGQTDGSDFGIWNVNKFTSIPLARIGGNFALSAVPEPTWGAIFLVGILAARRKV